jgi:Zn-dependent protease with chaperone function
MILAYDLRLVSVCLAFFFLAHTALGLIVSWLALRAVRLAARLRPASAARLLLTLRFLPAGLALFGVAVLCVPSYLKFELDAGMEDVGLAWLAVASLGLTIWVVSIARGVTGAARSLRYLRRQRHSGREMRLSEGLPVWVIEAATPLCALSGVLHPRLVVSRCVLRALSDEELAAALRHERAHLDARDNLKRLCLLMAPGVAPLHGGFAFLEHHWARFAEFAADDRAVAGDAERSLSLAAALVQVARLGSGNWTALETRLCADGRDLEERVDRLLQLAPPVDRNRHGQAVWWCGAAVGACLLALLLRPASLYAVHRAIERLMH